MAGYSTTQYGGAEGHTTSIIHPSRQLPDIPEEIPEEYGQDYQEVHAVIDLSPRASAALSRRVIEALLKDECGRNEVSLHAQIKALFNDPTCDIPTELLENIDVIRNTGNFAAHKQTDAVTGELLDVTSDEASFPPRAITDACWRCKKDRCRASIEIGAAPKGDGAAPILRDGGIVGVIGATAVGE